VTGPGRQPLGDRERAREAHWRVVARDSSNVEARDSLAATRRGGRT
jgi:hypothetical protein